MSFSVSKSDPRYLHDFHSVFPLALMRKSSFLSSLHSRFLFLSVGGMRVAFLNCHFFLSADANMCLHKVRMRITAARHIFHHPLRMRICCKNTSGTLSTKKSTN